MLNWQYFPRSHALPTHLQTLIDTLKPRLSRVGSSVESSSSDMVLSQVAPDLQEIGYEVEVGKAKEQLVARPVLFGPNGVIEKSFYVDAFHAPTGTVLEIEAGRAVVNNQFLKDFFEACAIQDAQYLAIAVLNSYRPKSAKRGAPDFASVCNFFDTLYASGRLKLPLEGILVIGYDGVDGT